MQRPLTEVGALVRWVGWMVIKVGGIDAPTRTRAAFSFAADLLGLGCGLICLIAPTTLGRTSCARVGVDVGRVFRGHVGTGYNS